MSVGHWLALGMFLAGFGTQLQGLDSWGDATSPAFVAGIILNLGSVIVAMYSKQIGRDPTSQERRADAR